MLQACLHDQREELTLRLRGIPYREHDSVHRARVATRRLRSALRGYAPLLDRDAVESLVGKLRWLARALGAARDLEVLHVRLEELLAEEPEPVAADALRTRLFRDQRGSDRLRFVCITFLPNRGDVVYVDFKSHNRRTPSRGVP